MRASTVSNWSASASAASPSYTCRPRSRAPNASRISTKRSAALKPDVVSINTWPDTHADYAVKAMEAGAHVFVEKPLAETVADAERVVATAQRTGQEAGRSATSFATIPHGTKFIELARTLGTPLVFRMNLNQQSSRRSVGGPQAAPADRYRRSSIAASTMSMSGARSPAPRRSACTPSAPASPRTCRRPCTITATSR